METDTDYLIEPIYSLCVEEATYLMNGLNVSFQKNSGALLVSLDQWPQVQDVPQFLPNKFHPVVFHTK